MSLYYVFACSVKTVTCYTCMIAASTSPSGGERADNQVTLTYIMKCLGGGTRIRVDVLACGVKRDLPTALRSIGLNNAPLWTYLLAMFCSTFFSN